MDMEALQIIVKKPSNEIVQLKKKPTESSSNPKKFFKFQPKKEKRTPTNNTNSSTLEGINREDIFQAL
jgi:hypothetical protein